MKKLFTFLAGAALLGSLSACSSDEPTKGPDGPDITTGDAAYLAVKIIGVDDSSRASRAEGDPESTPNYNDDFEFGESSEHIVNNAKFFFFDESGKYVLEAKLVQDPNFGDGASGQNNIEYVGKDNILVLDGLTEGAKRPTYMLTILNSKGLDLAGRTLNDILKNITTENLTEGFKWVDDQKVEHENYPHFVMSTSSYLNSSSTDTHHDDNYYFVTKINQGDYKETPEAAQSSTPIDIYVERLAAKVQVSIDVEKFDTTNNLYKLTQTVGGGENDDTGTPSQANTDVYFKILDWDLGGIPVNSYISKNLDPWDFAGWKTGAANGSWNEAGRFRSYWAKSTVYGNEVTGEGVLTYANNTSLKNLGMPVYCHENTNEIDKIFKVSGSETVDPTAKVYPERVLHATIHAQICDKDGNPVNMVMANGVLFTQEEYIKRILSNCELDNPNVTNLYYKPTADVVTPGDGGQTTTTKEYAQIDLSFFTAIKDEANPGVGHAKFIINDDKMSKTTLYSKNGETYSELDAEAKAIAIKNLKEAITDEQAAFVGQKKSAVIYDKGHFVYYVPIEHLNTKEKVAAEGYYGVVRNHWYKLSITKFSKVGHGIWEPKKGSVDEEYKPDGSEEYYYLGARINILSWKIVKQSVSL